MMKNVLLFLTVACSAVPLRGIAQNTATPPPVTVPTAPAPPAPPDVPPPPRPTGRNQSGVFLGVETTEVPSALSDQLNLPDGFGLLVEYVVPGSAAEAAGVKTHDILKMLNDQILTSEEQLSVLVRSFSAGQEVALLVLRKGQEIKLTAKLQKRPPHTEEHPAGHGPRQRHDGASDGFDSGFHLDLDDLSNPELADRIRESFDRSRAEIDAATQRANERVKRAMETVRERTARASGSRLDYDDAQILLRDSTGRIEIRSSHGKRTLTIRGADGKKSFDGPIDTPDQRKAIPADMLPQVEALEREQVITFPKSSGENDDDDKDRS